MKESGKISLVIIDDHAGSLELLSSALSQEGLRIYTASDPEEGLEVVYAKHPQIVLTDLVMPNMNGMEILERVFEFDPAIDVVLMTAHYSTESAVEAIRKGACDYLEKPVKIAVLRERIGKLLEQARRRQRAAELERELLESSEFEGLVGRSPIMWELFSRIRRVAPHFRTVLITGPTGAGKDLVARALHRMSPSSTGHYVVVNCSAVVETLFESELFGHVRGAFTGAAQDKMGLVEQAHGGTLFLDEIGDMPLSAQAKLLRTVQEREIQRVGSVSTRKVDVRVVAATNRDLRAAVAARGFREDLFYRLSMVEIRVPSLLERTEDLALLERYFLEQFSRRFSKPVRMLTQRAQIVLARHTWPGNVRELENVIGHACMMTLSDTVDIQDLPEYLHFAPARSTAQPPIPDGLADHERLLVADALTRAEGNQSQAARLLRIGRDALRYKMKKHNL